MLGQAYACAASAWGDAVSADFVLKSPVTAGADIADHQARSPGGAAGVVALICGGIRKLPDLCYAVLRLVRLREQGRVTRIVLSTWQQDLDRNPQLQAWLAEFGIPVVATDYEAWLAVFRLEAAAPIVASLLAQDTQFNAGIRFIGQHHGGDIAGTVIWKLRTDLVITRMQMFIDYLACRPVGPQPSQRRIVVHHISILDFFDIADIIYFVPLPSAHLIGGVSNDRVARYFREPTWTEAGMFGEYDFTHSAPFALYDFLDHEERARMRLHVLSCVQEDARCRPLERLIAHYLTIIARRFELVGDHPVADVVEIEAYLVGGEFPGLSPYRQHNQLIMANYLLERLRDMRLASRTEFGRGVLGAMLEYRQGAEWRAADTVELARLFAAEILVAPARKRAFEQAAERYCVGQNGASAAARVSDLLRVLEVPERFRLQEAALTTARAAAPSDLVELMRLTLTALADGVAGGCEPDAAQAKLAFWCNLFIAMDLGDDVRALMPHAALTGSLLGNNDRPAHLHFLHENRITIASRPA